VKIFQWGDGLAVQLPMSLVDSLGLKEGDDVEIAVAGTILPTACADADVTEVLTRLRAYRGRLPADFNFVRPQSHERDE
jgi:antitoxin MazE